jgi:hypothetical protein
MIFIFINTVMTDNYQLFSQLCESFVTEASTAMQQFNTPAAQTVLKHLHKNFALGHDIQTDFKGRKPNWTDLKDYPGSWLLINGTNGFAGAAFLGGSRWGKFKVITGVNGTYDTDTPDIQTVDFSSVTAATNHLKSRIGTIVSYYFVNSQYSRDLRSERSSTATKDRLIGNPARVTQEYIIKRFTPLFKKILTASKADVKGVIATMVKNDGFRKAQQKAEWLQAIDLSIDALESGTVTDFLKYAVNNAILMAAKYHYPDDVSTITFRQTHYQMPVYASNNDRGRELLLAAISAGEKEKLGTVLAFLKRGLV